MTKQLEKLEIRLQKLEEALKEICNSTDEKFNILEIKISGIGLKSKLIEELNKSNSFNLRSIFWHGVSLLISFLLIYLWISTKS